MNPYCPSDFLTFLSASPYWIGGAGRRNYAWSPAQCTGLFEDTCRVGAASVTAAPTNNGPTHFLGTILVSRQTSTQPRRLIVDGVQRLFSSVLLLMASIREVEARHDGVFTDSRLKVTHRVHRWVSPSID